MAEPKDVQDEEPEIPIKVDRAGVRGMDKKIVTRTPEGELQYDVTIDAYVDLPKDKRGIHMSRNVEAFTEAIEEATIKGAPSIEEVLEEACRRLLSKHPYAGRAELTAETSPSIRGGLPKPERAQDGASGERRRLDHHDPR